MGILPDSLPHTFTTQEASNLLKWQGSVKGLSHSLLADGFRKFRVVGAQPGEPMRTVWRRPTVAAATIECPCRCHTGTCGANDMDLAERTIRMIMSLRPHDVKVIEEVEALVRRAGVDHAKAALAVVKNARPSLYDEVPF